MIFTFYSYKGGVGRSMAMAGVAYLFSQRGLRVLAIDFDLEAPGLERYFFDGERCRSVRAQPGLLDLILDYRAALTSESAFAQAEFKNWRKYCTPAIHATSATQGSVDLMTAGRREPEAAMRGYALAVRSFDWQNFFYNAKGDLFFDWLRRRLVDDDGGYDVVLVDSRTGVTEMGGVCAYQLADAAVLLCAANYQNLEGTRDVARDFRSEAVRALRRGRALEIVAVPARIEMDHPGRDDFFRRFRQELGVEGLPKVLADAGVDYERLAIPYLPTFAVAERLVGEPQDEDGGVNAALGVFETLADALTLLAPESSRLHGLRTAALARLAGDDSAASGPLLADTTKSSAVYDVFIDCSPADFEQAAALATALEHAGLRAYLERPGDSESATPLQASEQALEYSQMLLVAFGRPTRGEWRAHRLARARRLQDVAILPVLLPGSEPDALASFDLARSQALDLRDWPAGDAAARLRDAVEGSLRARKVPAPAAAQDEKHPYPGPRALTEDDAALFFGRENEVREATDRLLEHGTLVLRGDAQVGKTSLVLAGIVPAVRRAGEAPGGRRVQRVEVVDLSVPARVPDAVRGAARPDLLVLDGMDSFDHGGDPAARRARIERIVALLRAAGPECLLVLVERDVLPRDERDAAESAIAAATRGRRIGRLDLRPLRGDALLRAITGPAEKAGHLLEPGLAERLVESACGARNAIAQIQVVLARIWTERKRGWLTNKALDAAGSFEGIVAAGWKRALDSMDPPAKAAAQAIFVRLTSLSGKRELVSAPQAWEPLATVPLIASVDAVGLRDRLAAAGMLDLYRPEPPASEPAGALPPVQVALSRPNPPLFLEDGGARVDTRYLLWRDALAPQMRLWVHGRADAVLTGAALAEAEQRIVSDPGLFVARELEFVRASIAERERREDARRLEDQQRIDAAETLARVETEARMAAERSTTRLRRGWYGLIGMLLISMATAVVAFMEAEEARKARDAQAILVAANAATLEEAQRALDDLTQAAETSVAAINEAAVDAISADDETSRKYADVRRQEALDKFTGVAAATIENCPFGRRLYLHIADEGDRAWATALVPALQDNGFIVPGIETVTGKRIASSHVRYFRERERNGADDAARILVEAGRTNVTAVFVKGYEESDSIRPCHYEAWFSAGAGQQQQTPVQQAALPTKVTIRYYRDSDAPVAGKVASVFGFDATRGTSALARGEPNALAFSADFAPQRRIEIATAFVQAGFPLRAITIAKNVQEPQLVQIVASLPAAKKCGLLTDDDLRAGRECGTR